MNKTCDITNVVLSGNIIDYVHETKYLDVLLCSDMKTPIDVQYRSASLSINPASRAGACTDCQYIECKLAIIIIVILLRSLFLVDIMCSFG